MALRCGEQFRRRYMEGEIIPPGIAAGRGTGLHGANEVNMKQKVKSKEDLPLSDLKDVARDSFINAFKNGIYLAKEDRPSKNKIINDGLNATLRLTTLYKDEVAPEIEPLEVEHPFSIDIPGIPLPLAGRMDIQREAKVDDLKSAGKSWDDGQIQKEIQPILYSLAHEHETRIRPEFVYHILVDLKTGPKRQIQKLTATDEHYQALIKKMRMFCKSLEAGIFLPANPSSWWCSEKWCGYYYTCDYVGNPKSKKEI